MNRTILAAALVAMAAAATPAAAEAPTPGEVYQSSYFLFGAYMRASRVCDYTPFVTYGMNWVASKEMQAIGESFKDLTTQWGVDGAQNFNGMVMKSGVVPACRYMVKLMTDGVPNPEKRI